MIPPIVFFWLRYGPISEQHAGCCYSGPALAEVLVGALFRCFVPAYKKQKRPRACFFVARPFWQHVALQLVACRIQPAHMASAWRLAGLLVLVAVACERFRPPSASSTMPCSWSASSRTSTSSTIHRTWLSTACYQACNRALHLNDWRWSIGVCQCLALLFRALESCIGVSQIWRSRFSRRFFQLYS